MIEKKMILLIVKNLFDEFFGHFEIATDASDMKLCFAS